MKKFYVPVILVLLFCLCGCKKAENPAELSGTVTASPDWTAAFGGQSAGGAEAGTTPGAGMTPKPTKEVDKTPKPTKTMEEKIEEIIAETGYPTAPPPREFTPAEEQTELVLWLSFFESDCMDEYMVAELNHILQERGYSFYLSVKTEPAPEFGKPRLSPWQEVLDAGETVDLLYFFDDDSDLSGKTYGKTSIERMITGGYLLPFSAYPDTSAKNRLRAAYGEAYWRLCSFGGENYGISNMLLQHAVGKNYLLLNLDAAEHAGLEVPEKLDFSHLDELLRKAKAAGVPGVCAGIGNYCKIQLLPCGLFLKRLPDGGYSFVNPFQDEEVLEVCDAMNRYWENGWVSAAAENPLVQSVTSVGEFYYPEDGRFVLRENGETQSFRVKVYEEEDCIWREGSLFGIFGISSSSRHKEEALELLCLMHTDEEIVRLLRYGLEGIHYRLGEDGLEAVKTTGVNVTNIEGAEIAYGIKTWQCPKAGTLGNPRMPLEFDETAGMPHREDARFYETISDVFLIPYPGDLLEGKKEQMEKIRDVLYENRNGFVIRYDIEKTWQQSETAYRQELEKMRAALEEAGYNELIAELNQRMEEK